MEPDSIEKEMQEWGNLIGYFVIGFGAVEVCSYQWILKLSSRAVLDSCIGSKLSQRLKLIRKLVSQSAFSADQRKRAETLWNEVAELAKTRNIIAHGPLINRNVNGHLEFGVLDVKQMSGLGPSVITPLRLMDIAKAGGQVSRLVDELVKPF